MPVLYQVIIFTLEVVWGVFLGFLFDCYHQTRKIWRPGHWGTSLGDIFYWVLVTSLTVLFLMLISWGEVRVYVFLAFGLGFLIYLKVFRQLVHKICAVIWRLLSRPLYRFFKVLNSFQRGGRSFLSRCRIFKLK
ncbi:MAG: spore cortex biosynthesis protein YabQ [Peptococcia bacterium]